MSDKHPRHPDVKFTSDQIIQQSCAAYVLTVQPRDLVRKAGEKCAHVGGNFTVKPVQWSEDGRTAYVHGKCAACGEVLKFGQTMSGPWERA